MFLLWIQRIEELSKEKTNTSSQNESIIQNSINSTIPDEKQDNNEEQEVTGPLTLSEKDLVDSVANATITTTTSCDGEKDGIDSFSVDWDSSRGIQQCHCGKPIDLLSRKVMIYHPIFINHWIFGLPTLLLRKIKSIPQG